MLRYGIGLIGGSIIVILFHAIKQLIYVGIRNFIPKELILGIDSTHIKQFVLTNG